MLKSKKKITALYRLIIQFFFKTIYGKIIFKKKILENNFIKKLKIKKKKFGINYCVYIVKKGRIYTDNSQNVAGIQNNKLYGEISFQIKNHKIVNPKYNSVLSKGTPRFKKEINGTVLSTVQGGSGTNYFHWLFEILPKIRICKEIKNLKQIDYIYVPKHSNSQLETLKLLNIPNKKILKSEKYKHIKAKELIFTDPPWYTKGYVHDQAGKVPEWIIFWLKKSFLKFKRKVNYKKKIFVDRTGWWPHCQIINKKEFENLLIKKNYQICDPAKLDFVKQIYLFWNATHIVGAHGAALSNLVFCQKKTKILELKPYGHPGKNYQNISKINKLNYKCFTSQKKYFKNKNGDIYIDLKKISKLI